jgi:hypothetical protein
MMLSRALLEGRGKVLVKKNRWTKQDDEMFRKLVAAGAAPQTIVSILKKTHAELRRRAYALGLPLKWFKRREPTPLKLKGR